MRIFTFLLLSGFFVANFAMVSQAFVPQSTTPSFDQMNQSVITAGSHEHHRSQYRGSGRRAIMVSAPDLSGSTLD